PAGVAADPAQYGLFGGRLTGDFAWGSTSLAGRYGASVAGTNGRWLQGDASVVTGGRIGALGVRAYVSGFGLTYLDPFDYDAGGVDIQPGIAAPAGPVVFSFSPRAAFGRWTSGTLAGDLRILGGTVEAHRTFGTVTAILSGRLLEVENGVAGGTFARGGGDLVLDRGRWTALAEVEVQRSPLETEVGGGVQLSLNAAPGFEVVGYVGRRVRDPLFGTSGTLTASVGVSFRALHVSPPNPPPVVAVGEKTDAGRVLEFAIRAPEADSVAVTGDFTGWDPVSMEESGGGWWRAELVVEPGLHHFGFLVDGTWAIPPDAPGVVEDGWGRRNASIVVEP
ncbi:MAG: glycogen-binding domain-containing protein, partial [Longimicrobiales bacterium]|nr:glycogen-binding domain-containing protein [Longimicrobiales bacterium]